MTRVPRRGVTKGYVGALIAATLFVALALLVAIWGGLSLQLGRDPVSVSGVALWAAPLALGLALALLGWGLWLQAIVLLKGRFAPSWGHTIAIAGGGYLLWCLTGVLAGLGIEDTWVSPYSLVLVLIWATTSLLFWAVLARRVYTDRPAPRWPWERREEREREEPWDEDGK